MNKDTLISKAIERVHDEDYGEFEMIKYASMAGSLEPYFGMPVVAGFCMSPDLDRVGRLIQIRKGGSVFGSAEVFIRTSDGRLKAHGNNMFTACKLNDEELEILFDHENFKDDSTEIEYTNADGVGATGFIVDGKCNIADPSFGIMVMKENDH